MSKGLRVLVVMAVFALVATPRPGIAQYMFLDSNGDGANTQEDVLNPNGTPTPVDVYIFTDSNADSSPAYCNSADGDLTIFSYVVNLGVTGGTATFTGFTNRRTEMGIVLVREVGDSLATTEWQRGQGGGTANPPTSAEGMPYRLMSITVTGNSGTPTLVINVSPTLPGYSSQRTSFGTQCAGQDQDNTYKLGSDWFDTDGVQPPDLPPTITAPPLMASQVGSDVTIQVDAVDSLSQFAPTITAQGYPASLSLSVSQVGTNASRGILSGRLGTTDAGTHTIVWAATDGAGLSSADTTIMGVSTQTTAGATIVGYTESGPGPRTISQSSRGIDAILGPWGGPPFSNGPCGQLYGTGEELDNRLVVEIDVGTGGAVSFTYEIEQTGTPFIGHVLSVRLLHGTGEVWPIWQFGNPASCWGTVWRSRRLFKKIPLNDYANQIVTLVFYVSGYADGTETQGRFYSIAIDKCGEPPLSPLSAEDQIFEIEENHWDESGLTQTMQSALNCLRTKVMNAGGAFDTSDGSAYRTPGYQAHLREVWDKWDRLTHKSPTDPDCQQLRAFLQLEVGKHGHNLATQPAKQSKHSLGLAFDATITGVDQDALACECNLYRPFKEITETNTVYDPPHFQLRPCPP